MDEYMSKYPIFKDTIKYNNEDKNEKIINKNIIQTVNIQKQILNINNNNIKKKKKKKFKIKSKKKK